MKCVRCGKDYPGRRGRYCGTCPPKPAETRTAYYEADAMDAWRKVEVRMARLREVIASHIASCSTTNPKWLGPELDAMWLDMQAFMPPRLTLPKEEPGNG